MTLKTTAGDDNWDSTRRWREILERRLNQIGFRRLMATRTAQADRISDVVELIEQLRTEFEAVRDKQEAMATWIKANVPRREAKE